ncbi:hypothetical protein [Marivirga harenae]|uniref:hypothetical protein n=1 Tax=Marivirga harenae TaxID=2010992 RepID=UPI0026E06BE2|nr:hypothetical protein [Marivirga harenae]WKV13051.1 hypothetical protein Q3Y49_04320 [Marivirga harenae]
MKNLFNFTYAISLLFLASCTFNGQDGAPGPRDHEDLKALQDRMAKMGRKHLFLNMLT